MVVLHGVNMVAKRPPYAPDATGFGADDAAFLAAEGYTTVRLGIIYAAVEPQPGVYDDAYLDRIAKTVRVLGGHGIVSLLDFHQDLYNERFQGEGWPDWAVIDDGLPAEPKLGFPGNYLGMPALSAPSTTSGPTTAGCRTPTPPRGRTWPSASPTTRTCSATTCSTSRGRGRCTRRA